MLTSGGPRGAVSIAPVQTLRRTPLYEKHVDAGARLVPFAGWEMPVQYAGVIAEHRAVRTDSGVFDVSHMGEIEVEGPRAQELLQSVLSNDVAKIEPGDAQYTLLTNEGGGIIDDLILYRLAHGQFYLVVNAGLAFSIGYDMPGRRWSPMPACAPTGPSSARCPRSPC